MKILSPLRPDRVGEGSDPVFAENTASRCGVRGRGKIVHKAQTELRGL